MHLNNAFNVLRVAKMLNSTRKIVDEISREDIIAKVDCNEKKKLIKIVSNM